MQSSQGLDAFLLTVKEKGGYAYKLYSHCTVRFTGVDLAPLAIHCTTPPFASLRTPLKVSVVLGTPLTVTISIPVKVVPVDRPTCDDEPLGVNPQPTVIGDPLSSAVQLNVVSSPSTTAAF